MTAENTPRYYYSTRDLLMMAALAALGGLASTYINFIGDFFQSLLGFAGTTQWAAGLHVLWLVLAVGLTRKQGAGTITGIIKGGVELFTGNTHGLLVVVVDIVAGGLVDLGLLPFRRRDSWLAYAFAGGIASASNVFVFQLFAAVPADILSYGVIGLIALMAFLSGVVFAGILGQALLTTLRRSGVVKDQQPESMGRTALSILIVGALLLAGGIFGYLKIARAGAGSVRISGTVAEPYDFSGPTAALAEETVRMDRGGAAVSYRGYPLEPILAQAAPDPDYDFILFRASDGYSFFITAEELENNGNLLLQARGEGENLVYNVVGPRSKKAWVNGVVEISLIRADPLPLKTRAEDGTFDPGDWVEEMDSTILDVGQGSKKYQGVPLRLLFEEALGQGAFDVFLLSAVDGGRIELPVDQVTGDPGIRVFVILDQGAVSYAVAHLDGEVYQPAVEQITLQ